MFSLRNFIKQGFLDAIGDMADYKIILNAASWNEKGVLELSDLEEINLAIEENKNKNSESGTLNEGAI